MTDLRDQIRDFAHHLESSLPTIEADQVMFDEGEAFRAFPDSGGPRWVWAAAALAAVVLATLTLAVLTAPDAQIPPAETQPAPPTTVSPPTTDPAEVGREAALAAVDTYVAAVNEGDVEAAMSFEAWESLTKPIAEHPTYAEELVVYTSNGIPLWPEDCEIVFYNDSQENRDLLVGGGVFVARVSCDLRLLDPLYEATSGEPLEWDFLVDFDRRVLPIAFEGGSFSEATRAFVTYARANYPERMDEACVPGTSYPTSFESIRARAEYVSFHPDCRQLYVELADEVAQWVRDGMPER